MLLQIAIIKCAGVFAQYLDSQSISPTALEAAIVRGDPVIVQALQQVAGAKITEIKAAFGPIAGQLSQEQIATNGEKWHPYLAVLKQPILAVNHQAHVEAILRHQDLYRQQMDAAVQFLRSR